jgi:hypothetical protein
MANINPIKELAKSVSNIDKLQLGIADLERRMDATILGSSNESESAIRLELSKLKAALGEARNEEAFWRDMVKGNTDDRKAQGELAKA